MKLPENFTTWSLALVFVVGAFVFFLVRGADPVITPIIGVGLGTVLSYFFAQHLSNGAAVSALNQLIARSAATGPAVASAVDEVKKTA